MIKWLLMTSISGSIATLLLILLRTRLAAKYGGRWYYCVCLVALLLFIIPLSVNVPVIQPDLSFFEERINTEPSAVELTTTAVGTSTPEQLAYPIVSTENLVFPHLTLEQLIIGIWLCGFFIMMYRYFFSYFRFKKQVIHACPIDSMENLKVVVSDYVHSPMIIGFFKPLIVIPNTEMNSDDYKLALQHEWIHYKQRDIWFKLLAVLVNSLHWFNPVSYVALSNIGEACEYSVDEKITKGLKTAEKKRYSEMILHFASSISPVLNSSLALHKKQLYRRFALIMKRKNDSRRMFMGTLIVILIVAVSVFSSSVVFAKSSTPLTESSGGIRTYYNYVNSMEENVQRTLGIKSSTSPISWSVTSGDLYIDADGRKIDNHNRTEPYYKVVQHWQDKETAVANMTNKTLSIAGQTVTVAVSDQAKAYIDDKVIKKMIINQINFELTTYQSKNNNYDHQAFINELIKRGAYVIEDVVTPEQFTFNLSKLPNGGVVGTKQLTSYDTKVKNMNIFNGKAKLPKTINNGEGNQGLQLGNAFVMKNGETLAIDIKETTDKMPTISLAVVDKITGELVFWNPVVNSGERIIFTPGENEVNHSFKVLASGEEKDNASIEIFTYKTGEAKTF
ncbi:M56 family metallopeptidase [Paenibacillus endoradicis]|uniref:M56 family metallopeptidase n=1 Tax=Paenibacillus endoradicis TaxID=2972487 RepID=UPI002158F37C|nr:M56 family metallopeptidase [Paenibacillus endoradicis]MCR8657516.1 M56 family metallopeptidase [Paenibacillus endoradicis]